MKIITCDDMQAYDVVRYDLDSFYINRSNQKYHVGEYEVIKIIDDERANYCFCGYCGKKLRLDEVEAHYQEMEASKNCETCNKWKSRSINVLRNENQLPDERVDNEDGTWKIISHKGYDEIITYEKYCDFCDSRYLYRNNPVCEKEMHRRKDVQRFKDSSLFIRHPNMSIPLITSSTLKKFGFEEYGSGKFVYKDKKNLKSYQITAYANKYGIVTRYSVENYNWNFNFIYIGQKGESFWNYARYNNDNNKFSNLVLPEEEDSPKYYVKANKFLVEFMASIYGIDLNEVEESEVC